MILVFFNNLLQIELSEVSLKQHKTLTHIINQSQYRHCANGNMNKNVNSLCLSLSLSHTFIWKPTDCVQFEDRDFVLGSLSDFPAILLEELLAEKHLVRLSVFNQAQLAEFLPMKEEKTKEK